jgi:hypothetical protein
VSLHARQAATVARKDAKVAWEKVKTQAFVPGDQGFRLCWLNDRHHRALISSQLCAASSAASSASLSLPPTRRLLAVIRSLTRVRGSNEGCVANGGVSEQGERPKLLYPYPAQSEAKLAST